MSLKELPCAYTHTVNFVALRELLRMAREARGYTLDQAAAAAGLNRATIHSIENIKREPGLKPELETIEQLVRAYGRTLSSFFRHLEAPDGAMATGAGDDARTPLLSEEETEAPFASETRIAAAVVRHLAELAFRRNPGSLGEDLRHAARPRDLAAELDRPRGELRPRDARRAAKGRPPGRRPAKKVKPK